MRTIVGWLMLVLKAWIIFCAANWFWPALGLTYVMILSALIVYALVVGPMAIVQGISAVSGLASLGLDIEDKDVKKWLPWILTLFDLCSSLFLWLVLWLLFLFV